MFFEFNQNNSGGSFDYDERGGITHIVVVEADSAADALSRASDIGLYFDGDGDCPCCGDRWSDYLTDSDGDKEPSHYGTPLTKDTFDADKFGVWMKAGREACVHYKDGRKEWF